VDGSLLRAWTSMSYLERIDGLNEDGPLPPSGGMGFGGSVSAGKKCAEGDLRGLLLSNHTHCYTSDDVARLIKKAPGVGALLRVIGHCVMENRNDLVVTSEGDQATGRAERDTALRLVRSPRGEHQKALDADKGYDTRDFVADGSRPKSRQTSVGMVDQRLMAALHSTMATPNRSTPGSESSRCLDGSNSQLASRN
jgi:hypothetical protein